MRFTVFAIATVTMAVGCVQTSRGVARGGSSASGNERSSALTVVEAPEDLTSREQRDWRGEIERFRSPCVDGGATIAACIAGGDKCGKCRAAADFVAGSIRAGFTAEQRKVRYLERFDPQKVQKITIRGAPSMGPPNAPVTVVEFADFECPFCAASMPLFDKLVKAYAPYVRVVFMQFPISYHPHGEECARAAVAAHMQGKFWPLHHAMFLNRDHLTRADILGYARQAQLDVTRFERDWDSDLVWNRVKTERQIGDDIGVGGTPSVFINGRMFDNHVFDLGGSDLLDWIELEIKLTTGKTVQPKHVAAGDSADE